MKKTVLVPDLFKKSDPRTGFVGKKALSKDQNLKTKKTVQGPDFLQKNGPRTGLFQKNRSKDRIFLKNPGQGSDLSKMPVLGPCFFSIGHWTDFVGKNLV